MKEVNVLNVLTTAKVVLMIVLNVLLTIVKVVLMTVLNVPVSIAAKVVSVRLMAIVLNVRVLIPMVVEDRVDMAALNNAVHRIMIRMQSIAVRSR